jgi:hypothetical protein
MIQEFALRSNDLNDGKGLAVPRTSWNPRRKPPPVRLGIGDTDCGSRVTSTGLIHRIEIPAFSADRESRTVV